VEVLNRTINYMSPTSIDEALQLLKDYSDKATIIAGGTDLIPQLRSGTISPEYLIDVRQLPMHHIERKKDQVRLGARVTQAMVLESRELTDLFPALAEACRAVGGPTIRNRATLGGNLANASPAADSAPPLLALDADVFLEKEGSRRVISLDAFFRGPGETVIEADELLTEICIPILPPKTNTKFIKLGVRGAMAIAIASVAVRLSFDQKRKIETARIALGSVAPTPLRSLSAEQLLEGESLSRTLINEAALKAEEDTSPISDVRASADYRKKMISVLVQRCLHQIKDELGEDQL
jgi:carbon-monoxide dehydrogenase medium subunit